MKRKCILITFMLLSVVSFADYGEMFLHDDYDYEEERLLTAKDLEKPWNVGDWMWAIIMGGFTLFVFVRLANEAYHYWHDYEPMYVAEENRKRKVRMKVISKKKGVIQSISSNKMEIWTCDDNIKTKILQNINKEIIVDVWKFRKHGTIKGYEITKVWD